MFENCEEDKSSHTEEFEEFQNFRNVEFRNFRALDTGDFRISRLWESEPENFW